MRVFRQIESLPVFKNAVITIGTFDGVHEGHRKIISALQKEAKAIGGESVLVTFHPHPRKIVRPNVTLQLINTLDEKIELLSKTGIDNLVIVPFTEAFAEFSADEYIAKFLVNYFQPHTIIIGYDHHFGKGRNGNYKLLEEKAAAYNYRLLEIPKHVLNEVDVSSTKIRNAILESNIDVANKLLGYSFFFEGTVIQGDQLGRKLGYPTANLQHLDDDKIHLGHGVYAVYVDVAGSRKRGMMSIGNRPTLLNSDERIEINIFDFNEDIYGKTIRITVQKYLRQQEKYPTLQALIAQLEKDKQDSLAVL